MYLVFKPEEFVFAHSACQQCVLYDKTQSICVIFSCRVICAILRCILEEGDNLVVFFFTQYKDFQQNVGASMDGHYSTCSHS